MLKIPPKYFWPGLVIALLLSSVVFWVGMLRVAYSDGGPQVVDEYYEDEHISGGQKAAAAESDGEGDEDGEAER
ncbi:MAG: FixH family protein [Persicimonas sp.]